MTMNGWRTIDSAPRDGTVIDLTWMEDDKPQEIWPMSWNIFAGNSLVQPHKGIWCLRMPNGKIEATWSEYNDGGGPTHWRPLSHGERERSADK
jgi:hypothetical protein